MPEFTGFSGISEGNQAPTPPTLDQSKPAFQAISGPACSKCSKNLSLTVEKAISEIDSLNIREAKTLLMELLNQLKEE